jgi:hypothetical protein
MARELTQVIEPELPIELPMEWTIQREPGTTRP